MNKYEATDGISAGLEVRQQRGMEIAALARIHQPTPGKGIFTVPSQHNPRPTTYTVTFGGSKSGTCTCLDHETRGCKCKHIWAVQFMLRRERRGDGTETVTESVTVSKTRTTYAQDWPNYNKAQVNEKRDFQTLLADLCRPIVTPPQEGRGQRTLPLSDAIFCAVFKVYSTMSARRFTSDLCDAQAKGYIAKVPHFNSVLNYLENPALYPILLDMIEKSSLPLRSIEKDFAVDSTGFTSSRFLRWYDVKYNKFTAEQQWVKAHLCCGVKTNVVTAIEIHGMCANDAPILPSLVESTAKNFDVKEVSADKGYSSRDVHDAIAKVGAVPFVAFKNNTTGKVGGLFGKMWHYFCYQSEAFLAHYHKRSNVESTVMMIKTKFGDSLRSKSDVAAKNEVLAKVLCHNLCCLIHAMYELGIEPMLAQQNGDLHNERP
jgi:transposase